MTTSSMSTPTTTTNDTVIGGVDTHADAHVAAAITSTGGVLGTQSFPTTVATPYRQPLAWLQSFGSLDRVGVEGTGSYGAALARHLTEQSVTVVEVGRPNRQLRRRQGKTDVVDAIPAARAGLSGEASATPSGRSPQREEHRRHRAGQQKQAHQQAGLAHGHDEPVREALWQRGLRRESRGGVVPGGEQVVQRRGAGGDPPRCRDGRGEDGAAIPAFGSQLPGRRRRATCAMRSTVRNAARLTSARTRVRPSTPSTPSTPSSTPSATLGRRRAWCCAGRPCSTRPVQRSPRACS